MKDCTPLWLCPGSIYTVYIISWFKILIGFVFFFFIQVIHIEAQALNSKRDAFLHHLKSPDIYTWILTPVHFSDTNLASISQSDLPSEKPKKKPTSCLNREQTLDILQNLTEWSYQALSPGRRLWTEWRCWSRWWPSLLLRLQSNRTDWSCPREEAPGLNAELENKINAL